MMDTHMKKLSRLRIKKEKYIGRNNCNYKEGIWLELAYLNMRYLK